MKAIVAANLFARVASSLFDRWNIRLLALKQRANKRAVIFLICTPSVLTAQDLPADSCRSIFNKALAYAEAGKFEKAILKFNAVKACDPNFTAKTDSIILTVFKKIDGLRQNAVNEQHKTTIAQERERKANEVVKNKIRETENALKVAVTEQRRADSLLLVAKTEKQKAELGERKMGNLSTYYKRKAEKADYVLLVRIIEYLHLKYPDFDVTNRLYEESLRDTTMAAWSNQYVFDNNMITISAIAISPDGQLIFAGDYYGKGSLWDLDGHELETFDGYYGRICAAAFSPDGKTIMTANQDDLGIRFWDLKGNLLQTIKKVDGISAAAFSSDGLKILTGNYDGEVILSDTSGKTLQIFRGHQLEVTALAFSKDGQYFITGSTDSVAHLYSISGGLISSFKGHEGNILSVAVSPNGQYFGTGSTDKTARLWNREGKALWSFRHEGAVTAIRFSDDSDYLLTGSLDNKIRLYHWADTSKRVYHGHTEAITAVGLVPNSTLAVSAARDRTLRLWDLSDDLVDTLTTRLQDNTQMQMHFSLDAALYSVLSRRGELKIYSTERRLLQNYRDEGTAITKAIFSPDGKYILTANREQRMKLWDLNGNVLHVFEGHGNNRDSITNIAFSPDGALILSQSRSKLLSRRIEEFNEVKLWNRQGKLLSTLKNVRQPILGFMPDGKSFLTHGDGMNVWKFDDSVSVPFGDYYSGYVSHISTKHKRVLQGGTDNVSRLFDESGKLLQEFPASSQPITALSLSPNGKWIMIGSEDSTVRIWDTAGHLIQVLPRQDTSIHAVAFSHDSEELWFSTDKGKIYGYRFKPMQMYSLFQLNNMGIVLEPDDILAIQDDIIAAQIAQQKRDKILSERSRQRQALEDIARKKQAEEYQLELKEQQEKLAAERIKDELRIREIASKQNTSTREIQESLRKVIGFINESLDSAEQKGYYALEKQIFEQYKNKPDSATKKTAMAEQYNSMAWSQILAKQYVQAELSIRRGMTLDSTHKILYTNLAPSLLFQGKFAEAKAQYLQWKDKEFGLQDLPTFEDAFWDDFNSFKEANCIPPAYEKDVEAIKKLLTNKKEE